MCDAIQQMNEESSTLLNNIKNLMEKMGWSAEQSLNLSSKTFWGRFPSAFLISRERDFTIIKETEWYIEFLSNSTRYC